MAGADSKRQIPKGFPQLNISDFQITSPADPQYNCIAWAAGVSDEWWDPTVGFPWPGDLPRNDAVKTLLMVYQRLGYVPCKDGAMEAGYEKVAIYGKDGIYLHAARQLPDGSWTSKLGKSYDIEHSHPECIAGGIYGTIVHFLKRPRQA